MNINNNNDLYNIIIIKNDYNNNDLYNIIMKMIFVYNLTIKNNYLLVFNLHITFIKIEIFFKKFKSYKYKSYNIK